MSEAKGPYKIGRPEEYEGEGGYVSERLIGPGLGRWGAPEISDPMTDEELTSLVATANAIYSAGRASRDGLRKAMEDIAYGRPHRPTDSEIMVVCDCLEKFANRALEADGEGK